jgi:peptidyl-prolyl cis-trans isomerase SurA
MIRLVALILTLLLARPGAADLVDGVAGVVDDEVILLSEVEAAAAPIIAKMEAQHGELPPPAYREIRMQALQALIDSKLIQTAALQLQLEASEEDVDEAIASIAAGEGVTVDEIYAAVQAEGMDRADYRNRLKEEITRMKVISAAVRSRVTVRESEINTLFEKRYRTGKKGVHVTVRHILIPWPPDATEEQQDQTREVTEAIRTRATDGADFGALARQYSRAPSAADGGLTVFSEGEVTPELAPYVFGMEIGEISPPIQTAYGLNLVQVLERFEPETVELNEVRENLYGEIFEAKTEGELRPWLDELRETRYIEVVAPELK